jgi:hypothetical protein
VRTTLDSTLAWSIAGPILGLVIVSLLARAAARVSEGADSPITVVQGADVL